MSYDLIKPFLVAAFLIFFILDNQASAYLDPGTASYIFQLFIAGIIGGLFAIKLFWNRITSFFKRLFVKKQE
jgi:hypothetical protein